MTKTLTVWVGASIIYLYGTVNGETETFTLVGDGYWQAIVPRSEDDNYDLHLEAYSENGLEGTYEYTLYYGMMPCITDRTAADVRNKTEKGFYNYTDLNRVGHVVQYLGDQLNTYGYAVSVIPKLNWTQKDIPRIADMETYLTDLNTIKAAFYGTTELPGAMDNLDHIAANNIEKLLLEIEGYIKLMLVRFRPSGTFAAGQQTFLPRRVM